MSDLTSAVASAAKTAWWIVVVRGIVAIALGIMVLVWPGATARVVILLFGFWALIDGAVSLISIVTGSGRAWGWLLIEGILGVGAGIIVLREPKVGLLALVLVVAFWSLMIGALEISGALRVRSVPGSGWGWLLVSGAVSILFGILLIANPGVGVATLVILLGIYAIAIGVVWLISAFMIRKDITRLAQS